MTYVYLINQQDRYCPEKNNGDFILEAWSTKDQAERRCKELDSIYPTDVHYVLRTRLDKREDDYEEDAE